MEVDDDHWTQLARNTWLIPNARPDPEVVQTQLWAPLLAESFPASILSKLDALQVLEKFLWLTFGDASSDQHVLLIAVFTNFRRLSGLDYLSCFKEKPDSFPELFHRILSLTLDSSSTSHSRLTALNFVIGGFQSLENEVLRKVCAPLVSISIWTNLHSSVVREKELEANIARRKAWKISQKRFDNATPDAQVRLRFERAWLFSIVLSLLKRVNAATESKEETVFCERMLELLVDLLSQLPTRRYTIVLLKDLNVFPVIRNSRMCKNTENALFRDLTQVYKHFLSFAAEESGGEGTQSASGQHMAMLGRLQKIAFTHFEAKLRVLALSNLASLSAEEELRTHLQLLSDEELERLCGLLGFRTTYPKSAEIVTDRSFLVETLVTAHTKPPSSQNVIRKLALLPTEKSLYDPSMLRDETWDGSQPLAHPKLNLQYLSLADFLWRSFQLYQTEAFYEIRSDMENIVRRMKPRPSRDKDQVSFDGFSKMAIPISKPAVLEVGQPKIGMTTPSFVRAEIVLDVGRLGDRVRSEWERLRPRDVVFLLCVRPSDSSGQGHPNGRSVDGRLSSRGLTRVRAAEVVQVQDEKGKPLRDTQNINGHASRVRTRRLIVDLDPVAFSCDKEQLSKGKPDVYNSINVVARRSGRENNFRPVLETIQRLVGLRAELPTWLQEVYLGYGDPKSASYHSLLSKAEKIDFLDTFLDWQHLKQSFPGKTIEGEGGQDLAPPYVLQPPASLDSTPANPRKRRRAQMEDGTEPAEGIKVSTYKPLNTGPYPVDVPKKNKVRFTPAQVNAIASGTQPGLSVIVGPPGTGKTDVATQIINLLYHNFPSSRILLVAHSNQALNQLFQKIIALDIDPRHLLRLGHGEEDLESEASYTKHGRVESFMENRAIYLAEVDRLAASVGAEGAHGSTCETADYFNQVFIQPEWTKFWTIANSPRVSREGIVSMFPFHKYFSNAPVPELFPAAASVEETKDIAAGCQRHLSKIFEELDSIRPFEILRHPRDQANHLLVKEARIIAMTTTHAAIRRSEIAEAGFRYDTLIMEEAAQVTEIESFIPCALQNPDPKTGELPLQRIVLVGDHLQNSPIVQNNALRGYSNLEQSLFLRLVRLGVPTITLDQQGRCRPSIANLFSWRYPDLRNLPRLLSRAEFARANAGFAHEYQFVHVDAYQGQGEREPTPHFIQNLGEAEYAVALYQYMRLLGYPASSISILTAYAGQRALIRDVLEHRCKGNKLFGTPKIVTTVDKYQGEQNDYVILSLVRTKSVGYLRDVRRLTVALSRARLGLYILGRKELFATCKEMEVAVDRLNTKGPSSGNLEIVTGEMFPTSRQLGSPATGEGGSHVVEMHGVEHLGQYVYEMTQAKIKAVGGTAMTTDEADSGMGAAAGGVDGDDGGVVDDEKEEEGEGGGGDSGEDETG